MLKQAIQKRIEKQMVGISRITVDHDPNPSRLTTPTKRLCTEGIKAGLDYFKEREEMVKTSFLVCSITNALDGSENGFIHCAKELSNLQVVYHI